MHRKAYRRAAHAAHTTHSPPCSECLLCCVCATSSCCQIALCQCEATRHSPSDAADALLMLLPPPTRAASAVGAALLLLAALLLAADAAAAAALRPLLPLRSRRPLVHVVADAADKRRAVAAPAPAPCANSRIFFAHTLATRWRAFHCNARPHAHAALACFRFLTNESCFVRAT